MPTSLYSKDEKVLCFHQELLYDAKILDVRHKDPNDRKSDFEYLVHYKGWKNTWDDWVTEARLRKLTEENRQLAAHLKRTVEASLRSKQTKSASKKRAASDRSSVRDSEERGSSVPGRGSKRARGDNDIQTEDDFYATPSIHFLVDDNLKAYMVDDWERITKQFCVVKLPHPKPVRKILQDWQDYDLPRRAQRLDRDVLVTVCGYLLEIFDKSLDKELLYSYERPQYRYLRSVHKPIPGCGPVDIYGAEHLLRLFTTLGDDMAQGVMGPAQVRVWQEELNKLAHWLSKNSEKYFLTQYILYEDSYGGDRRFR